MVDKRTIRVVIVALVAAFAASIVGTAIAATDSKPSESEFSREMEKPLDEREQLVPPANNATVVTSQSGTENRMAIMAFTADGRLLYYNDTYHPYFDVDPVPGTSRTVEYVAAQQLNGTQCNSVPPHSGGTECIRNVIERVNLSTGNVTRVYSEYSPSRHLPSGWHDVDRIGTSRLLVADIFKDRVFIVNTTTGFVEWEWQATSEYTLESGGHYPRDWTHVNDVELLGDGRVMVSLRNHDQVIFIDRKTGLVDEWTIGEDDDHAVLYEQHNPDYIPPEMGGPAVVVADSENNRIVEYQRQDGEWNRSWVWSDPRMQWPRDADRLPNGNTLISDTHSSRVLEINPDGEVVWTARIPDSYEAERLGRGDESAGGESATSLAYESQTLSTAETDEVALDDRIRLFMKSLIPPKVVHGIVFLAPEWMNALSLITTVALVGTVVLWGVIEIRWWLRGRDVAFRSPISIEEQE